MFNNFISPFLRDKTQWVLGHVVVLGSVFMNNGWHTDVNSLVDSIQVIFKVFYSPNKVNVIDIDKIGLPLKMLIISDS